MTNLPKKLALVINPYIILFALTALLSVQTAYAFDLALQKLMLLALGLGIYVVIAMLPAKWLPTLLALGGFLSVAAALHFWFAYDWVTRPVKVGAFHALGVAWQEIRPNLPLSPLYEGNSSGSIIASFLPFLIITQQAARHWFVKLMYAPLILFVLATILLTGEASVWLLLLGWGIIWFIGRHMQHNKMRLTPRMNLFLLLPVVLMLALILLLEFPLDTLFDVYSRIDLFGATRHLIGDFPLIGAGLATFPGLYSYYIVVTPHLVLLDAHNLWLDVWLEQGILGSIAILGIFITAFWCLWHASIAPHVKWAIFISLALFLSNRQTDNVAYGTVYTPLLFVLPALIMQQNPPTTSARRMWFDSLLATLVATCLLLVIRPNALQVNRTAIEQARIDLVDYPSGRWDDRSAETWTPVATKWQATAANDRTANHRMGLIALQAHQFDDAVTYLSAALAQAPQHRGLQKNLGYAHSWSGDPQTGLAYLSNAGVGSAELFAYGNWWLEHDRDDLAQTAVELSRQLQLIETQ